ncbi:MAG: ECF-type sigma factor [Gammaproteobacteria bacterium]
MSEPQLDPLIDVADSGDEAAHQQLFRILYQELHRIAECELRRSGGSTLSPTTVLHEAYIAISGRQSCKFADRARFMAYASRAMRGLIIDHARNRRALKRGGAVHFTSLRADIGEQTAGSADLERIGEAVEALGSVDERLAQVVDLKFFCGFSFAEIAAMHGMSERTVQRDWDKARILLHRFLTPDGGGE